ncbi:hypothetical protein MMC30_000032 [Trapelia coarctata]|nr:hypothetical protein [Trapelia coarctata]
MKFLLGLLALAACTFATYDNDGDDDHKPGCNSNNCARAVTGTRFPTSVQSAHRTDCSSFMKVVVTPAPTTITVTLNYKAKRSMEKRQITVVPSAVPTYASACSGTSKYSSACSCWGITKTTSTAPTPTVTVYVHKRKPVEVPISSQTPKTAENVAMSAPAVSATMEHALLLLARVPSVVPTPTAVPVENASALPPPKALASACSTPLALVCLPAPRTRNAELILSVLRIPAAASTSASRLRSVLVPGPQLLVAGSIWRKGTMSMGLRSTVAPGSTRHEKDLDRRRGEGQTEIWLRRRSFLNRIYEE